MSDSEKLILMLILCDICIKQDDLELRSFVKVCSRHVDTNDFNKILRKSMKILDGRRCGHQSCPDWLMNELFVFYKKDFSV